MFYASYLLAISIAIRCAGELMQSNMSMYILPAMNPPPTPQLSKVLTTNNVGNVIISCRFDRFCFCNYCASVCKETWSTFAAVIRKCSPSRVTNFYCTNLPRAPNHILHADICITFPGQQTTSNLGHLIDLHASNLWNCMFGEMSKKCSTSNISLALVCSLSFTAWIFCLEKYFMCISYVCHRRTCRQPQITD